MAKLAGPNAALSLAGLTRGPDRTTPTPAEDWRQATVDVVIPRVQRSQNHCVVSGVRPAPEPASSAHHSGRRRQHGWDDCHARAFCEQNGVELIAIQRAKPIGKTPTIKRQAIEFDSDVEFILDGDTVLESRDYLERAVQELYQGIGIASACGFILPLRRRDRRAFAQDPAVRRLASVPQHSAAHRRRTHAAGTRARDHEHLSRGPLSVPATVRLSRADGVLRHDHENPVGCAVAYRRKYVEALFRHVTPRLGDDLTNSEDIFLGMGMLNEGYRNIQLTDVYARTVEPTVDRLPRQVYCGPHRSCSRASTTTRSCAARCGRFKRWQQRRGAGSSATRPFAWRRCPHLRRRARVVARRRHDDDASDLHGRHPEARRCGAPTGRPARETGAGFEPYRQPFGREHTLRQGRPVGWLLLTSAIEKVFFPTALLTMLLLRHWEALLVTIAFESLIGLTALVIVTKGERMRYLFKGLAVLPVPLR